MTSPFTKSTREIHLSDERWGITCEFCGRTDDIARQEGILFTEVDGTIILCADCIQLQLANRENSMTETRRLIIWVIENCPDKLANFTEQFADVLDAGIVDVALGGNLDHPDSLIEVLREGIGDYGDTQLLSV